MSVNSAPSAMVLAAGLGTRMRPLTDTRPKPLVEVNGQTLLDHVLDILQDADVSDVVVNVHYLADQVEKHLASGRPGMRFQISDERKLLMETGGGVAQALSLISSDPFLVINSDNIWTTKSEPVVAGLLRAWDEARMDALLLLVPHDNTRCHKGQGDFYLDGSGLVSRRKKGVPAPFTYTGLQMVSKRLFDGAAVEPFSMNILWDKAMSDGRLFGVVHDGEWFDVGTPAAVTETERLLLGR